MKVKRTIIGSAVVAAMAAMAAFVITGCGWGVDLEPPPVLMVEVFNLDDWMEGRSGTLTDEDIDEPFQRAGGQTVVRVVSDGLRIEPQADWAGLEFFGYNGFEVGDVLSFRATAPEFNVNTQFMLQVVAGNPAFTGWPNQHIGTPSFIDGVATIEVTLTVDMINRINADDQHGVEDRIRLRLNNPEGDGVFVLTGLTQTRNMATPNVAIGAQSGTVVRWDEGAASYRTVLFPITTRFLEGGARTITFTDAMVTGLPDGVSVAGGSIAIGADGSGATTAATTSPPAPATHLALIVDYEYWEDLEVGEFPFTVTLGGTASLPGTLFISGLVVPERVTFDGEGFAAFTVEAFRLNAGGASSVPLVVSSDPTLPINVANPGIVLDANGSGRATLAFYGGFDFADSDDYEITVAAPGTRASESFTLTLGMFGTVFDMQEDLDETTALVHFAGSDNNRGVVSIAEVDGDLVATVGNFGTGPGGTEAMNDPQGNAWSPITILRPGQARGGDILTVTGYFSGTGVIPMSGTQIGLSVGVAAAAVPGSAGGGLVGRIDTNNNVTSAEFEIEFVLTSVAATEGLSFRWNSWTTLGGAAAQTTGFAINITGLTIEGYR